MTKLNTYRKQIDAIDKKIVSLLLKRFSIAKKVSLYKKKNKIKVLDNKRELVVLKKIKNQSKDHKNFMVLVYKKIMDYSKKIQRK